MLACWACLELEMGSILGMLVVLHSRWSPVSPTSPASVVQTCEEEGAGDPLMWCL